MAFLFPIYLIDRASWLGAEICRIRIAVHEHDEYIPKRASLAEGFDVPGVEDVETAVGSDDLFPFLFEQGHLSSTK